jgi:hypothetical protein
MIGVGDEEKTSLPYINEKSIIKSHPKKAG